MSIPRLYASGFASANRGSPSCGSSSHGARESTNEWYCGRIPGSPSSEPSRIEISSPSGQCAPNRLEPHTEQNALTAPPSGRKTRISSSPASKRNPSRGTRPIVSPKVPECFRQREQWQWFERRNGAATSKRTPPHRQLPRSGSSIAAQSKSPRLHSAADVQGLRRLWEETGLRQQPEPFDGGHEAPLRAESATRPRRPARKADPRLRLHPLPQGRQGPEGDLGAA